ncbi:MAG: endonuclease/exonuclease/phosphatase family protein [Pirellulales bacterium]
MKFELTLWIVLLAIYFAGSANAQVPLSKLRIATYNISFYRDEPGQLLLDLQTGEDESAKKTAEVIQRVRPDVMLLNEIDYDPTGQVLAVFQQKYLSVGQAGQQPIEFPHSFTAPVNTGKPSGLDLNQNGKLGEPDDAWGFGRYPGQYGMAVLSRFPIDKDAVRTFKNLRWSTMPDARRPVDPKTRKPFHPDEQWNQLRLASKSFWDVPIPVGTRRLHLLCSHPTPPVFDGPEDRNGCRNFDEIRLVADYVSPNRAHYIVDDRGTRGGLAADESFIILGDLNADPVDGDSIRGAIQQLLNHSRVHSAPTPQSNGGVAAVLKPTQSRHRGNPAHDTGNFSDDGATNLRVDYVLPSRDMNVLDSGVFWPAPGEAGAEATMATDHRAVWVEIAP